MPSTEPAEERRSTPEISEFYRDYSPPIDATAIVQRLLPYVPQHYLRGLRRIVLMNSSGLSHDRKRVKTWSRKRTTRVADAAGTYNQAWQGDPAWIQIFVDNITNPAPQFMLRIPFIRDLLFATTLYHEIGHHIHKTARPEFREREDVAEEWERKLTRRFVFRKYWYLLPIILPIGLAARAAKSIRRKLRRLKMSAS